MAPSTGVEQRGGCAAGRGDDHAVGFHRALWRVQRPRGDVGALRVVRRRPRRGARGGRPGSTGAPRHPAPPSAAAKRVDQSRQPAPHGVEHGRLARRDGLAAGVVVGGRPQRPHQAAAGRAAASSNAGNTAAALMLRGVPGVDPADEGIDEPCRHLAPSRRRVMSGHGPIARRSARRRASRRRQPQRGRGRRGPRRAATRCPTRQGTKAGGYAERQAGGQGTEPAPRPHVRRAAAG